MMQCGVYRIGIDRAQAVLAGFCLLCAANSQAENYPRADAAATAQAFAAALDRSIGPIRAHDAVMFQFAEEFSASHFATSLSLRLHRQNCRHRR